ncbi:uncharacterized protein LOC125316005 [Rhodamnia argentea]|uniref:Uncharacterized protein LOC125316005 n=1 Tax=Rhodamnia argentea TaxID=178133 RepID=A0ABM3HPU2_9MYRT|nr:uncharacterized protein LOC125316005 [Rhodamnia argentea]
MSSQPLILAPKPSSTRQLSFCRPSYFASSHLNLAHKPYSTSLWTSRLHLISTHVASLASKLPYLPEGSLTEKLARVAFVFGSGKGTRRANFIQHFGFAQLNGGDLLQAEIQSGYRIGLISHCP